MPNVAENPMLVERARGDSLRTIGRRHGIHHEQARRIVLQQGRTLVDNLARDLRDGTPCTVLVPWQPPDDWQDALLMLDWCARRLREQGLDVRVVTRPSRRGAFFVLTLKEED